MAYDGRRIVLFGGAGSTTPEHCGYDIANAFGL